MFFKYFVFYVNYIIKDILYVDGKFTPIHSIKDKQSSPHAWG